MPHRDPGHRVAVSPGAQRVTVVIDGQVVADSTRPLLLHETGLPVRYYLPAEDVRLDLLEPTDTSTTCPYKGRAEYWSFRGGPDGDAAWSYPDPYPEVAAIRGCLSFYDSVADIRVEG